MQEEKPLLKIEEIIPQEDEALKIRREKLFSKEHAEALEKNRFGIALSGGGIRSATINLGFLKTLNRFGILKNADYLSTVSGGGYCGSYVQTTLKESGNYDNLFSEKHIDFMRQRGSYLVPGKGVFKFWNQLVLIIGYLASWVMSLISPAIILLLIYGVATLLGVVFDFRTDNFFGYIDTFFMKAVYVMTGLVIINYLLNLFFKFNLPISQHFHKIQTGSIGIGLIGIMILAVLSFAKPTQPNFQHLNYYAFGGLILVIIGFFTSPNASSFHRFYRNRLAEAFLNFAGKFRNVPLKNLFEEKSTEEANYLAPMPFVNTCLNLQATDDPKFKGTKTSDYFLLSPKFCGSKLTGYVRTEKPHGYDNMTFPAAVTISAAAVNPGMGNYSNKILAVLTTLLNARLGYWTRNPIKSKGKMRPVWWPVYFFYELFSKIGTDKQMLNISDGGHIENLASYELLRRKCRLIIGVDAGEDINYGFSDLESLVVRAKNELGVEFRFREDQSPEEVIRPKASDGYSKQRYATADLLTIWEEFLIENQDGSLKLLDGAPVEALVNYFYDTTDNVTYSIHLKHKGQFIDNEEFMQLAEQLIDYKLDVEKGDLKGFEKLKFGTYVYVKSSVTAPKGKPPISKDDDLKFGTYKYKIHHPNFPHEPTSDQFFDEIQWESYYQLGQFIGAEVLKIPNFGLYHADIKKGEEKSLELLIKHFDGKAQLFKPEVIDPTLPEATRTRGHHGKTLKRMPKRIRKLGYEM